jgi:lipopolysaccharide assembly protein A
MRALVWLLRAVVFVALFGLAVKNSGPVDLRFYLDSIWRAPLSLVLLAAFVAGAAIGLSVALATVFRQRRELDRLREPSQRNP